MRKTLLLIDGSSYLFQAFHGVPELNNAQGFPTEAIQGVMKMLLRAQKHFNPDYMVCVFDAPGKTFRDVLFSDYKAHRAPMPDRLRLQIQPIHQLIQAYGLPLLRQEGVEADDLIATLATQASALGIHTYIESSDKDLAQLVNAQVQQSILKKQILLDSEGVKAKYGVRPEQIVDYLMLLGDNADGVPGVPKVGEKTAAKWLNEYGSLQAIIHQADSLKGKVGESFRASIAQFALTRQLITLKNDCVLPNHGDFEQWRPQAPNVEQVQSICAEYALNSLQKALLKAPTIEPSEAEQPSEPPSNSAPHYQCIHSMAQLQACLTQWQSADSVAIYAQAQEGDFMQASLVGLAVATATQQAWYIPLGHQNAILDCPLPKAQALALLRPWLEDAQAPKIVHDAKQQRHVLANEGIALAGVCDDIMLMAYTLQSQYKTQLPAMAIQYLGAQPQEREALCGKGAKALPIAQLSLASVTPYVAEQADFTLQLWHHLHKAMAQAPERQATYDLEKQLWPVLWQMERHGICLHAPTLQAQSAALDTQLQALSAQAFALVGYEFNLNSPKQLGNILFTQMGLPVLKKTATGAPSTDEDTLQQLAHDYPLPKLLLQYRSLAKLKSTYTDKLPTMLNANTQRIHTHFSQAAVVTGRLSSSDPNLQNIPVRTPEGRRVRTAFVAPEGHRLVSADYSQIELRVMAHISGDPQLQQAFAQGDDIHRATAAEVFGVAIEQVTSEQRRAAKAINFGLIYGMGAFGLANNLGISVDAAQNYIQRYFARYPKVAQYMQTTREQAAIDGYVQTVFGRRLWLPELKGAKGAKRAAAERIAINAPMQGTAADLIKKAMVAVQAWIDAQSLRSRLVLQVHDELIVEVPEQELAQVLATLPKLMESVATLAVPLLAEVGVGNNWEQAH